MGIVPHFYYNGLTPHEAVDEIIALAALNKGNTTP